MLKQINSTFKEKLFYFLFYDILFFLFMFIFFVFVRLKLLAYQLQLEQFTPTINSFTTENLDMFLLQETLGQINDVANRALMFIYIAIPLGIFLVWSFFQGSSWQMLSGKKRFDFKYLLKFSAVTLPFLILILFVITKLFAIVSELFNDYSILFGLELWTYIILLVLLVYFMLITYAEINKKILKNFLTALKKIYIMLPIAFIFMLILLVLFVILTYIYILFFSGTYTSNLITTIILFLAFLLLFIYFRIFIFAFFNKILNKGK